MIDIQVYSDIHIELLNILPIIPVKSKYLFLAGDICTQNHPLFYQFFDYCSHHWEQVFYTPGNHEFYIKDKNHNELSFNYNYKLKERYSNVFYLDNTFVSLNDEINVYGSTFWTNPPFTSTYEAQSYINDYNWITYFKQSADKVVNLDITYVKKLANTAVTSLEKYLNETTKKTIIMTHFPPLRDGVINPKYLCNPEITDSYFTWPNNTVNNFKLNMIPLWISGHTHWSYDFQVKELNNIRFIGNQLGYKPELGKTRLNEEGLYKIDV